jgi:hypothetical protein
VASVLTAAAMLVASIVQVDSVHSLSFHPTGEKASTIISGVLSALFAVLALASARARNMRIAVVGVLLLVCLCLGGRAAIVFPTVQSKMGDSADFIADLFDIIPTAVAVAVLHSRPPRRNEVAKDRRSGLQRVGDEDPDDDYESRSNHEYGYSSY